MPKTPTQQERKSYRYDTLGALIDGGYKLSMHCQNVLEDGPCRYWKELDLEKLARRLGRDHGSMHHDLIPYHLWCLECGSRNVSLILHSPDVPGIGRSHFHG